MLVMITKSQQQDQHQQQQQQQSEDQPFSDNHKSQLRPRAQKIVLTNVGTRRSYFIPTLSVHFALLSSCRRDAVGDNDASDVMEGMIHQSRQECSPPVSDIWKSLPVASEGM
jgi:hypothetical protein